MPFTINGFTQDRGFRVFNFVGAGKDPRTLFTVRAELALVRQYGIRMQELPLLCLRLLEGRPGGDPEVSLTFTEAEMRLHAERSAAERDAARKRKGGHG